MTGELQPAGDGTSPVPREELRVSYEDRDRVAEQLRVAAGDGRLSAEELDERLEIALTARTYAELARVTRDLPSAVVTLDFTEAVITQPLLPIDAEVGSGILTLVTKPGIVVDMDEVAVRSGSLEVKAPWGQDASVLRIEVSGKVGSGMITARPRRPPRPPRPPRRTFWQWLTRQPRPRPAIGR